MSKIDQFYFERLDADQWTPIFFKEVKKDDILRMFDLFGNLKYFDKKWLLIATHDSIYNASYDDYSVKFEVFR